MKNACNDNEELSFITLSAATKNVMRYLDTDKEKRAEESDDGKNDQNTDQHREADARRDLEWRIRDMTRMENALRRQTRK